MKKDIIKKIQVNLPLRMADEYISKYLELKINPEIGIDSLALDQISFKEAEKAASAFKKNDLTITMHGPFLDLNVASPDAEIRTASRKRIYSVLDYIDIFQPSSIVFHGGYDYRRYDFVKEDWFKRSCDFWSEFAQMLNKKGVSLHLENVYETNPFEIKPIVECIWEFGGGFCFDTGHHFSFGSSDIKSWINVLGKYIKEIHLHDNDGISDLHLPPGMGKINFEPLKDYLVSQEFLPCITLEPHKEEDLWPCLTWMEKNNVFR